MPSSPRCSALLTHHFKKGFDGSVSGFHDLRGSSAIGGWVDGIIALKREEREDEKVCQMSFNFRDVEPPDSEWFALRTVSREGADHCVGLDGFRLEIVGKPQAARDDTAELRFHVYGFIKERPGFYTTAAAIHRDMVARGTECSKKQVSRAVAKLLKDGIAGHSQGETGSLVPLWDTIGTCPGHVPN